MSEQAFFWILGIGGLVIAFVAGRVWNHEQRIATLEADNRSTKDEVSGLRKRWHDLRDVTIRDLGDLYKEKLEDAKTEIRRLIGK